jgi:hypothetical protein
MTIPIARKKRRAGRLRFGSAPAAAPAARRPARHRTATGKPLPEPPLGDHLDRLFRAAWALSGSRADAEELVQDTYAGVLARPPVLRNDDDLGFLLRALLDGFVSGRATARRPRAAGGEPAAPERRAAQAGAGPPTGVRAVLAAIAAPRNGPARSGRAV